MTRTAVAARQAPATRPAPGALGTLRRWSGLGDVDPSPSFLLAASASFLVIFGLIMVLSASSVESYAATGSPFATALKQAGFAAAGVPLALLASRLPLRWWRRLAWPVLVVALVLQVLVFTPLGVEANGNRNWVEIGPVTAQPAEALKLALVLWVAHILDRKAHLLDRLPHLVIPLAPVTALALGLVLAGRDVGSGVVLVAMLAGMLFAAGVRVRYLGVAGLLTGIVLTVMVLTADHRVQRVESWLSGRCEAYYGACWQPTHGQWALASGGWWGLGLGASREKWAWLPEAHNDFIYAIIGEELGLPGTLTILALFAVLVVSAARIAITSRDRFVTVAATGIIAWVGGQALLNIGVVLGLLPVAGVPLPLVSSGGSSLVTSLIAIGMLASFARIRPRAGPGGTTGGGAGRAVGRAPAGRSR